MSVLRIDGFRIKPGRQAEVLSMASDITGIIRKHGGGRTRLMRIAFGGTDTGLYYGEIEFETTAAYATYSASLAGDATARDLLRTFYGPDGPVEEQSSMLVPMIAALGTRRQGYDGGVELIRSVEVKPGRMDEFKHLVEQVVTYAEEHGAFVRLFRIGTGGRQTGAIVSVAEFPDMAALGTYLNRQQTDPDLRARSERLSAPDSPSTLKEISIHQEVAV